MDEWPCDLDSKGPGSAPDDLRPLTVLSTTYRCWARRHARLVNNWLDTWAPIVLVGARHNVGAADVLRLVHSKIDAAVCGDAKPLHILSLDQSQSFDRLFLDTLADMATHLRLDQ